MNNDIFYLDKVSTFKIEHPFVNSRLSEKRSEIEVEQKFSVPDDVDIRLLAAGFVLENESTETISDVYYDTSELSLISKVII